MKNQTKLCKHCRTEIDAKAKICPNCRRKQGIGLLPKIVIGILVIGIIGAITNPKNKQTAKAEKIETTQAKTNSEENNSPTEETETTTVVQTEEERTTFGIGEMVTKKDISVGLVDAVESSGSSFLKPDAGNVFLLLNFEIQNDSSKDIAISSMMNFEAYCDDYALTQSISGLQAPEAEGKSQLDGKVASGKKMNGVIAYEVPADYSKFEITVKPDFWSSSDIKFEINK